MGSVDRGPSPIEPSSTFTLEAFYALPQIDLRRTPLTAIIDVESGRYKQFLRFMRLHFAHVGTMYRVGALLGIVTILAPREIGLITAAPAGLLTLPSWFLSLMTLSSDMMAITVRQFEFWYFTALNVLTWVLLSTFYWDFRVVSLVGALLGAQNIVLLDANFRTVTNSLKSCVVAVPAVLLVAVVAFFRLIDTDDANFRSIYISGVEVELADVCANTALTLALFVARKAYLKRKLLLKKNRGVRTIRCVVFLAKLTMKSAPPLAHHAPLLGFSPVVAGPELRTETTTVESRATATGSTLGALPPLRASSILDTIRRLSTGRVQDNRSTSRRMSSSVRSSIFDIMSLGKSVQQVALVPHKLLNIDVRRTVVRRALTTRLCLFWRVFLRLNGAVGLVLTPVALLRHPHGFLAEDVTLALVALATTATTCLPMLLYAQRDVLRGLLRNFDYVFVSVEFTIAMTVVCDMIQWGWRSLAVAAWFLWFHTVLISDAVTPPVRKALGLSKRYAAPVLLLSLVGMVGLAHALLFTESPLLTDRVLFHVAVGGDRHVELRTKSVLLNRLLTLIVWSLRLLWELACCAEPQLVFVKGSLEYYTPLEMFPPVSEVAIAPLSVLPATAVQAVRRITHQITTRSVRDRSDDTT